MRHTQPRHLVVRNYGRVEEFSPIIQHIAGLFLKLIIVLFALFNGLILALFF